MARGPKSKPAAVKRQRGNPGHRPVGEDPKIAAAPALAAIRPPPWLKNDALKVWQRLAPRLIALKLLTPTDVETFARYCRNFARWLKMNKVLDDEGETYETETYLDGGKEGESAKPAARANRLKRAHPAYLIADRLERQLLAAEDRFGLNPAERQRIFAARAITPDPAARDLFGDDGKRPSDPASKPSEPAKPSEAPTGYLN